MPTNPSFRRKPESRKSPPDTNLVVAKFLWIPAQAGMTIIQRFPRVFDHVSVYNLGVSDDDTLFGKAMVFGDNFVSDYDRRSSETRLPGDTKGLAEEVAPA